MQRLILLAQDAADELEGVMTRFRTHVKVDLGNGARHHVVRIEQRGTDAILTAVIRSKSQVARSPETLRSTARLAWTRNASAELVTFLVDTSNNLVGRIRHPAATLDHAELVAYLRTMVRECDRFEYLLSGKDRF
jgi:hypothetical protein